MKKIISLLLAMVLLLSCVPAAAATEEKSVTVYLSISKHNDFAVMNGKTMALQKITVPYFDLALYGLEAFYYHPDCYAGGSRETQIAGTAEIADGHVTLLHLLIFATEVIYNNLDPAKAGKGWLAEEGKWNGFSVGGSVGSSYCVFWEYGNNATYYQNYEYPLGRENYGATCDQILLDDNDIVSVRYNANTGNDGTYYHFGGDIRLTATRGDEIPLTLFATSADYDNGGVTVHAPVAEKTNIYVTANTAPANHVSLTPVGRTDDDGNFTLKTVNMSAGTYYITTNTHDPAVVILTLEESEEDSVVYGDLNGDAAVNVFDAAMAYAIVNGKRTATADQQKATDVNGDGTINVFDAALIYAFVNGKTTSFPAESK